MSVSSLPFGELPVKVLLGGLGLFIGYFLGLKIFQNSSISNEAGECSEKEPAVQPPTYTVALIVNSSLKMGKGKIAAQCGHAILSLYKKAKKNSKDSFAAWKAQGQDLKIVMVKSADDFDFLEQMADMESLNHYVVADAGRTQIKSGSLTVMGVGPGHIDSINSIVGQLQPYL